MPLSHSELRTICSAISSYPVLLSVKPTATQKYYMENYRRKTVHVLNSVFFMQFNKILYSSALFHPRHKSFLRPVYPTVYDTHPLVISSEFSYQTAFPVPRGLKKGTGSLHNSRHLPDVFECIFYTQGGIIAHKLLRQGFQGTHYMLLFSGYLSTKDLLIPNKKY